jgi:hypothetical protein
MAYTVPNGRNTIQKGQRIYKAFPFQGPLKFTQIGIFGLKKYQLATLFKSPRRFFPALPNQLIR